MQDAKKREESLWDKFFGNKENLQSRCMLQEVSDSTLLNDEADIKKLNQYHDTYFNALIANEHAYLKALEQKSKRRLYDVCKNFVGTDFIEQEKEEADKEQLERHNKNSLRGFFDEILRYFGRK